MDLFRWTYIGSGSIAKNTAKDITTGNHSIACVYSRNRKTAEELCNQYDAHLASTLEEAINFENSDGIYIATPHTNHLETTIKALSAHRPVLCEKPVAVSEKQAQQMILAAKENNTFFAEAMWTWFSSVAHKVKSWVITGQIGKIKSVKINYAFPGILMKKTSRVLMPETAGGALLDIGIYPITYCYNLFGYPKKITCKGKIKDGIDISETVKLFYDGFVCTLNMSLCRARESCVIKGEKGKIYLPVFHMASKAIKLNGAKIETYNGKTDYLTQFTHCAQCIKDGKTQSPLVPWQSTLDCLKIMDECRKQMNLIYPFEEGF